MKDAAIRVRPMSTDWLDRFEHGAREGHVVDEYVRRLEAEYGRSVEAVIVGRTTRAVMTCATRNGFVVRCDA